MSIIESLKELEVKADEFLKDLIDHEFYPGEEKQLLLKTVDHDELRIHKSSNNEEKIYIHFYSAEFDREIINLCLPFPIVRAFLKLEDFLLQTNPALYQELTNAILDYYENPVSEDLQIV